MPKEKKGILSVILNGDNPVKVSKKQAGKLRGFFKKIIDGLTSTKGLKIPEYIEKKLWLNSLISLDGFKLPEQEYLDLSSLTSAKDLKLPEQEYLDLSSLTSLEGLKLPEHIELPEHVEYLDLSSLTSLEGLKLPEHIGDSLDLSSLTSLEDLDLSKCNDIQNDEPKGRHI